MSRNGAAMSTSAHSEWVTGCWVRLCRFGGHASSCLSAINPPPRPEVSTNVTYLLLLLTLHRPPSTIQTRLLRQIRCPPLKAVV